MAKPDPYPLTRQAELQVALAMSTTPRFFQTLGHAIEADRMPSEDAQHLVAAALAVGKLSACTSTIPVVQHLRSQVNAGRLTYEAFASAAQALDDAEDLGNLDSDALVAVVAPVVRKDKMRQALEGALAGFGKGDDPMLAVASMEQAALTGTSNKVVGHKMGSLLSLQAAMKSGLEDPIAIGVPELDDALGGGLERSALGVVLANSGDGKSLFLCHAAVEAALAYKTVAYATLELSPELVEQRLACNLADMTNVEMQTTPNLAHRRIAQWESTKQGNIFIGKFPEFATTPADLRQWLLDLEAIHRLRPDLLVVDYADRMVQPAKGKAEKFHDEMKLVYQGLRDIAVDRKRWVWTATQSTGRAGRRKKLDMEDVAESMHKMRIADLVVALVRTEEDTQNGSIRFRVPKRRVGAAHAEVGPMPMDAAYGRLTKVVRINPWP